MIRLLYTLAVAAVQPLLRRKLRRRGAQEPGYLHAMDERFGRYARPDAGGALWIHAVSLGETRAAGILLDELRALRPDLRVLLTHGTATGREEGARLLRDGDAQAWLPWDTPWAVRRFLDHFRPVAGVLMETEVWPNLAAACRARGIPLMLVNARLSAQSLRQTLCLAPLMRPAYAGLAAVWAQTDADAQRLARLGASVRGVLGNLKFDATVDAAQHALGRAWRAAAGRPVILLASSREGEEAALLAALRARCEPGRTIDRASSANATDGAPVPDGTPGCDVQWLIVPRHPQRFDAVAALAARAGLRVSRRSAWHAAPEPADVWIGDSLGEMALYYGLADVALLGGSFEPLGGQNLIEAAACGCPVVMGPHTFNFSEAAALAIDAGCAWRAPDMDQAIAAALALLAEPVRRASAAAAGERFAARHRGAARRLAEGVLRTTRPDAEACQSNA